MDGRLSYQSCPLRISPCPANRSCIRLPFEWSTAWAQILLLVVATSKVMLLDQRITIRESDRSNRNSHERDIIVSPAPLALQLPFIYPFHHHPAPAVLPTNLCTDLASITSDRAQPLRSSPSHHPPLACLPRQTSILDYVQDTTSSSLSPSLGWPRYPVERDMT